MGRLINAANWLRTLIALGHPADSTSSPTVAPAPPSDSDVERVDDETMSHPSNFDALSGYHLGIGDALIGFGDTFHVDENWDPNFAQRYFPDK
jgi:hypothetical protein